MTEEETEEIEEDLEEYDDIEEATAKAEKTPMPEAKGRGRPRKEEEMQQAQPQVYAVPRAVSVEEMFNQIYDGQQEIKQLLLGFIEAITATATKENKEKSK